MSDYSQSRSSRRRSRDRQRQQELGRDLGTPAWRHLGTSEDKYGRLLAGLRRMANEHAAGQMRPNSATLARDLVEAATDPWLLKRIWDRACGPDEQQGRQPGRSGLGFEDLERWDSRWNWCRMLGNYAVPMAAYMKCLSDGADPAFPTDADAVPTEDRNCHVLWNRGLGWPFLAPYRRVYLKKPGSRKRRPIDIAEVWDWLIEKAVQTVVRDLLTVDLPASALAYRDGVGTEDGLARAIATADARGLHHWLSVDLENAYGAVVHPRLRDVLDRRIPCPEMVDLVMQIVATERRPDDERGGTPRGLPQGSPLSPFLFNAYVAQFLDLPWQKRFPQWPLCRYGDDIVVLTASKREAREAHRQLGQLSSSAGFRIQAAKTRNVDLEYRQLTWLGHQVARRDGQYNIGVPERSWQKLQKKIEGYGAKNNGQSVDDTIAGFIAYHGPAWASRHSEAAVNRLQGIIEEAGRHRPTEETRRQATRASKAATRAIHSWRSRLQNARRDAQTNEGTGPDSHRIQDEAHQPRRAEEPRTDRKKHPASRKTQRASIPGQMLTAYRRCGAPHLQDAHPQVGMRPDPRVPAETRFSATGTISRRHRPTRTRSTARHLSPPTKATVMPSARGPPRTPPPTRPAKTKAGWTSAPNVPWLHRWKTSSGSWMESGDPDPVRDQAGTGQLEKRNDPQEDACTPHVEKLRSQPCRSAPRPRTAAAAQSLALTSCRSYPHRLSARPPLQSGQPWPSPP